MQRGGHQTATDKIRVQPAWRANSIKTIRLQVMKSIPTFSEAFNPCNGKCWSRLSCPARFVRELRTVLTLIDYEKSLGL